MKQDETGLYIEQMIESYRWYGRLYPALDEVRELMSRDGQMYRGITACMDVLSAGNHAGTDSGERGSGAVSETYEWDSYGEADMESFIRHIPARLGTNDIRMIILHTAIACMEKNGTVSETALDLMEDELIALPRVETGKRDKRKAKNRGMLKQYDELQKLRDGKRKKESTKKLAACIREDINIWMLGMSVYTEIAGADKALKMSQELVGDLFSVLIRRFRQRLLEEGVDSRLCSSFMSELGISEAGICMRRCFIIDDKREKKKRKPGGVYLHINNMNNKRKRRGVLFGRGVGVVAVIMLVIVMTANISGIKPDDKEAKLRQAMTGAMKTTVANMDNMDQTNALMALFMQKMLSMVDDDVDLTVRICEMDRKEHELEVEAVGEYDMSGAGRRRVAVRRRISF